jgi:uncharacterized protein YbjT (DUF2867 family)
MRVLVCGANGFIGSALCAGLTQGGHRVLRGVRPPAVDPDEVAMDFARDVSVEAWLPRVREVDAVVNAVGAMAGARMQAVHADAPLALFAACSHIGVHRVVQISALGAAAKAPTAFLRTKHEADCGLMASGLEWFVLRPSLVAGRDGVSSRAMRVLASLPAIPLPGAGTQSLQPVALGDLVEAVLRCLSATPAAQTVDVVGPQPLTLAQMLARYRAVLALGRPLWLPVPLTLVRAALSVARPLTGALASRDALRMLEAGSTASPDGVTALLGRPPRPFTAEFESADAAALRAEAVCAWAEPLLRIALATVWLVTAWVSLFVFPVWDSLRLLARVGVPGWSAPLMLVGAAVVDAVFGALTLLRPSRPLWRAQLALIVFYSAVIAWRLPEMWAHPFGPLLKNVPIVVILIVLLGLTPARRQAWSRRT